jgi:hypothetical protein
MVLIPEFLGSKVIVMPVQLQRGQVIARTATVHKRCIPFRQSIIKSHRH